MIILDWLEDIINIPAMKAEITNLKQLCSKEWTDKNVALGELNLLQKKYLVLNDQTSKTIVALEECRALTVADKQTITALQVSISELNGELSKSRESLYFKPLPALLSEIQPFSVLLSDYVVNTVSGSQTCKYPDHPSIFQPSPIFENVLTKADCNRNRHDITSVEIATKISNALQTQMSYVTDQTLWGRPDNWTPATLAFTMHRDDCETLSCVILSALFYYQLKFGAFKDYSCFFGSGHLKSGTKSYGHGFVMLIHDTSTNLSDSFIIEATDSWASKPMPISSVKDKYDCDWGLIGYIRNAWQHGTYVIKEEHEWWKI